MFKRQNKKLKSKSFKKITPTMISLLAVCCALTAIKLSYIGSFLPAVSLVLFACFLDGIDGRIARYLNVASSFGVEIDSLADVINFGVAPGFILYNWKMNEIWLEPFSWSAVLLLACCMAIRLARFNVDITVKDHNDPLVKYFFVGMPAPAVAGICLWPMVLSFRFGSNGFWTCPYFVVINTIILSIFAASRIPTPCFKKIKVPEKWKNLILIVSIFYLVLSFTDIWLAFSLLGVLYIISIIIGLFVYLYFKKNK